MPVRRFSKLHRRQERRLPASAVVSSRPKQSLREIANLRFTRVVCAVVVLKVAVVTFVGFQWKVLAAENFLPAEDSLTRFFGATYAVIFLITGLIQLLVAGRFFRTFGLLAGLTVFPIMLAIANIGILATAAPAMMLAVSTLARGCDVFRRGIEDPSTQIVYGPLPTGTRRLTIALVVGIAKPVAEALAAVLLLSLMAFLSVQHLSYAVLLCIVPWLIATTVCYREYVRRSADSRPDTEAPPVAIQSIEVD